MKKIIAIILLSVTTLTAQIVVPMKNNKDFSILHTYYDNGNLTLLFNDKYNSIGFSYVYKLSMDYNNGTYERTNVFDADFTKANKKYNFTGSTVNYLDEYAILKASTSLAGEANYLALFVHNLLTNETIPFEIELSKGRYMSLCKIIKNQSEDVNELIVFSKETKAHYWSASELTDYYRVFKINIDTREVTESNFELKSSDFSVDEILALGNAQYCLIKYSTNSGTGYALLNFSNMDLTGLSIGSDYKYIRSYNAIEVKDGVIFSVLMGDEQASREMIQLGVSYMDGTITQLKKESYDSKEPGNWDAIYYKYNHFYLNNEVYSYSFYKKNLHIIKLSLQEVSDKEYVLSSRVSGRLVEMNENMMKFYCDNSSEVGGKKTFLTIGLSDESSSIEELDKKYEPPYDSFRLFENGSTRVFYYKKDKEGITFYQKAD